MSWIAIVLGNLFFATTLLGAVLIAGHFYGLWELPRRK
jgi:hypothetical protein